MKIYKTYIVGPAIEDNVLAKKNLREALINALRQEKLHKGFNTFDDAFLYAYMLDHNSSERGNAALGKTKKTRPIFTIEFEAAFPGESIELFDYAKYVSNDRAKKLNLKRNKTELKYRLIASGNIRDECIIRADFSNPQAKSFEFESNYRGVLSWNQKQDLLVDYIENEMDDDYKKTYIDDASYQVLNNRNNHLISNVVKQIPSNELYPLFYDSYERLNEKYQFNQNDSYKNALPFAIKNLSYACYLNEFEQSKKKALISTVLFSLFIVTIPFAPFFYKRKVLENYRAQNFQELAVDYDVLRLRDEKEGKDKIYGLGNKIIFDTKKDYKEVLFNKKHEVRKHLGTSTLGSNGYTTLFGTKRQLEDSARKFQACMNSDVPEQNTHSFKK